MTYEGKTMPTRDHVMPKSMGFGYMHGINKVICCEKCNCSKGNKHIISWWWNLHKGRHPRAPFVFKFIMDRCEQDLIKQWPKLAIRSYFEKEVVKYQKQQLLAITVSRLGSDELACSLTATWH